MTSEIAQFNQTLDAEAGKICDALMALFDQAIPEATSKVWHGHPVWFLGANPVVGYSLKKVGVQVLFWSGQSFKQSGLTQIGKFQAAGVNVDSVPAIAELPFAAWMRDAVKIQWDYASLPKKRSLEKLTKF